MRIFSGLLLARSSLSVLAGAALADGASAVGFWVTPEDGSVVQMMPCDSGLCGVIVGLRTTRKPVKRPMTCTTLTPPGETSRSAVS